MLVHCFCILWLTLGFFHHSSSSEQVEQVNLTLPTEICRSISKIVIHYRNYFYVYLGKNHSGELHTDGYFYRYIKKAVPSCCPNLAVEFVFENGTGVYTEELALKNVFKSKEKPMPFEFYFPEFLDRSSRYVYEYRLPFVRLARSPGEALLMLPPKSKNKVVDVMANSAFMLLFMLILSWLFGILGWAADHWKNPDDFPSPFIYGMFEGFWWSIITMTTVGYGDKTTKSCPARAVAVVWVMLSAVLLALFTAHVTTLLNRSLQKEDYSKTYGLKIGVLMSKHFDQFRLNLQTSVTDYSSWIDMSLDMKNGKLDRLLFPDYRILSYLSRPNVSYRRQLEVAKLYDSPFQIGMVLALDPKIMIKDDEKFLRCLRTALGMEERRMMNVRHDDYLAHLYTATQDEVEQITLKTDLIIAFMWYTLAAVAFLTCIGIAWDIWQYLKARKARKRSSEEQTQNNDASAPMEKVRPLVHYSDYAVTTVC